MEDTLPTPQMILDRVKFELHRMIGDGCIDYRKIERMLEGQTA